MRTVDECRSYVDHLIAEHRRLHRMLRSAHSAMIHASGPDHDATTADIIRVLRQVRDELAHHFTEEEGGGCLEEAVSHCPSLSTDSRRLQAEHPQLLESIDRLIAQAMDCDQSVQNRIELERGFDELCSQLNAHEAAENVLLRKGFGATLGSSDQPNAAP